MKYPDAERVKGMILWWASLSGPTALPGNYTVKLSKNGSVVSEEQFELLKDPRSTASDEDRRMGGQPTSRQNVARFSQSFVVPVVLRFRIRVQRGWRS